MEKAKGWAWTPSSQGLAQARSPFTRQRLVALLGAVALLWLLVNAGAASQENLKKYYCFGPEQGPMQLSADTYSEWHGRMKGATPVRFNTHQPLEVENTTVHAYDLESVTASADAAARGERVLILCPLKDAAPYLPKFFELLMALTYPHELIDLAFLVSDTSDETMAILATELDNIQKNPPRREVTSSGDGSSHSHNSHNNAGISSQPFRSATIFSKDFGSVLNNQNVDERHSFEVQAERRKLMGKARNYLLYSALRPDHSWVFWRDVDIVESPPSIIEDFTRHNTDVLVPNIWFHRFQDGKDIEGRFDYNSWVESEQGLALAESLPKDTVLAEGYKVYDTGRKHMARLGDWRKDKDEELELDGVGGVSIMVKADVHRSGINFPCYAFENQAETEGFAKMAKRAGYRVVGLPNYVVWHIDTEEKANH